MAEKPKKSKARKPGSAKKPKPTARKSPRGLRGFLYWSTVAGLWCMICFAGLVGYVVLSVTGANDFRLPQRTAGVTMLAANGDLLAHRGTFRGDEMRLDEMPPYLPEAVIATEDRRYRYHFGIDPIGLTRAMVANYKAGRIVQGGSTLTQQLAKNLFLSPDRTFHRKAQEMALAVWLELKFSKDEILQLYLNRVYFGAGAYGVDAAAHRYFGKSARAVNLSEAAILAGLLKAPSRYAPTSNPKLAKERARLVLHTMEDAGFIEVHDRDFAIDNPATITGTARLPAVHYVVDWISELMPGYVGLQESDLIVETTIDPHLQKLSDAAISKWMDARGRKDGVEQAALVMLDTNGAVKALVGGRSYADSQFNRAVKARRQPGSAFKPFVYLTALENGLTPATIRQDRPVRYGKWAPRNYGGKYRGPMSLKTALAVSSNVVAARLIREVGPKNVMRTARRLGIRSPLVGNLSLALGTSEVTPLELTAAYTPFANGGYGVLPYIIHKIRKRDGTVLYRRSGSGPGQVVDQTHLARLNAMMTEVVRTGTGRAARLSRHHAAGKTGTSQDFRDAWFIGYTSQLVTGVWVGNDDGKVTKKVTGGGLPAKIWHDVMEPAHAQLPGGQLPVDQGSGAGAPESGAIERLLSSLTSNENGSDRADPVGEPGFWQRLFGGSDRPRPTSRIE